MINASLKHTTAMTVSANVNTMVTDSVKNKLRICWRQFIQTLLDDVISVQVLNKLDNSETQSTNDGLNLARGGDEFDHLL